MAWTPRFRLVRPDDQLVIDVAIENLTPFELPASKDGRRFELRVAPSTGGRIWLQFPAQQLLEYATPDGGARAPLDRPIIGPKSDVVLIVPKTAPPIPLTVDGLLAALGTLQLAGTGEVDALDAAPQRPSASAAELVEKTARSLDGGPVDGQVGWTRAADRWARRAAHEPRGTVALAEPVTAPPLEAGPPGNLPATTRLAGPNRLALLPPGGATRLRHAGAPRTHDGRTELWTSALEILQGETTTETPIAVGALDQAPAANPTSGWQEALKEDKLQQAITNFVTKTAAEKTSTTGPKPTLERHRMSALGAWSELRGGWPGSFVPVMRHSSAMGRDQRQRTAVVGRLYPFGHTAIKLTETARDFETERSDASPTSRAAALVTATTVVVLDPVVNFPCAEQHPQWPFDSVEILTKETPAGGVASTPSGGAALGGVILRVGGEFFRYHCRALDRAGQLVDFDLAMLFVPGADTAAARTLWGTLGDDFDTIGLDGQPLAVAPLPPPPGAAALELLPTPEHATSVLARSLNLSIPASGAPTMSQVIGRVPALEKFAPGAGEVALSYAQPYIDHVFDEANKQGQLFLELAETKAFDVAGSGLASLNLPIQALSAGQGVLAGTDLTKLAAGKLDLSFLKGAVGSKLLGLVPLEEVLPEGLDLDLADTYRATVDVLDGVTAQVLTWDVPLFTTGAITKPFVKLDKDGDAKLTLKQGPDSTSVAKIEAFALEIYATANASGEALVRVPIKSVSITAVPGKTPDVDLKLGKITFGGILGFIARLADTIDQEGFSDPPALAIREDGVDSSFTFPVPQLAIGVFALENISIGSTFSLRFSGEEPVKLHFAFSRPEDPFRLSVAMLGGGGWVELGLSTKGLTELAGALEFGASVSVDLVVASGSVEAMGGIGFHFDSVAKIAEISGYFRIRGELDVLSLIAVSVTLTLTLAYDFNTHEMVGEATLAVSISVLFFHETVTLKMTRRFAGGNQDPTLLELMAPAGRPGARPWDTYCAAFAED